MFAAPSARQPTNRRDATDCSSVPSRVTRVFDPVGTLSYLGSTVSPSRCEGRRARILIFMDKKRIVISAVVFCILAVLIYLQYRHWQSFDWGTFWAQTGRIKKLHVLRAVRWKILLQPVRPKTKVIDLVPPTLVGFTGLAVLGRAGEFIRPYLIARRTELSFSSQ